MVKTTVALAVMLALPAIASAGWLEVPGKVYTNDKVGIGVADPNSQLTVVDQNGGTDRGIASREFWSGPNGATVSLEKARGNQLAPYPVAIEDYLGAILYRGLTNTGWIHTASVGARVSGPVTDSSIPTELYFATSENDFNHAYKDGTVRMVINSAGNVGIGTTTPGGALEVAKAWPASAATNAMVLATSHNDNARITVRRANLSPNGTLTAVTKDQAIGNINFRGYDGANYSPAGLAAVIGSAEDDFTAASQPARLTFFTTPANAVSGAERMRIDSTGNVGIGTTAPTQKLEVNGGIRMNATTNRPACDVATRGTIWVTQGATDSVSVCLLRNSGYKWRTIVSSGDDEHVFDNASQTIKHKDE